ncbi:hypothetical protein J3E74DRAFT_291569 [Bipolaris maydis]|nr:hypothetical protein J3E74DRAFT_291569 [Bipolaris maydis]
MAVIDGESIEFTPRSYEPLAKLDTITFSKLLDRNPEQISKLMAALLTATMLDNLDGVNLAMRAWFAQPESVKRKYLAISMASHGYKPIGSQAGTHGGRDGWEVLKTGRFEMQSRWGLAPVVEQNYETFEKFQTQCHYMTKIMLDRISNALGMTGDRSLNRFHRNDCPSKSHNMHTDYGTLTLVFAPQWGLQVMTPVGPGADEFEWQYVEPRPGCAVVNVADALRFLTNDRLRSAVHRVLPLTHSDRYSVTYFLRPSDDTEITDAEGKTYNVMDWYDKKNKMYETSHAAQDRSLLIGNLYKNI